MSQTEMKTRAKSLLSSLPIKKALEDRAHNSENGGEAESYAMAKVILACRGEGRWGSREEDSSKIDLMVSCAHPWCDGERMLILSQVKSGSTYGKITDKGFELKARAFTLAKRTSHGICVIWVDRVIGRVFWAYVHPESLSRTSQYASNHEVSPAMVFDLARCMSVKQLGQTGAKGILIRRQKSDVNFRRKRIKGLYHSIENVRSPVVGDIQLSRLGWRHMLRKGRLKENKAASLDLVPYLEVLLRRWPTTQAITETASFERGAYLYKRREHLLKYENLTVLSREDTLPAGQKPKEDMVAHIRLIEEIRYPINWEGTAMLSQVVSRRVVLKSAYFKAKKIKK